MAQLSDSTFEISSDVLAKDVYLFSKNEELNLDDNFFDLMPKQKRIIKLQKGNVAKTQIEYKTLYEVQKNK